MSKRNFIQFEITGDMKTKLKALAKETGVSVSQFLRLLINTYSDPVISVKRKEK